YPRLASAGRGRAPLRSNGRVRDCGVHALEIWLCRRFVCRNSALERLVDYMSQRHHVVAAFLTGDDEAKRSVEPIAGRDAVLFLDDEFRLRAGLIGGKENGNAALGLVLIHQLRSGLRSSRQQAAAKEGVAAG